MVCVSGGTQVSIDDRSFRLRFAPLGRSGIIRAMATLADELVPDELWALVAPLLPGRGCGCGGNAGSSTPPTAALRRLRRDATAAVNRPRQRAAISAGAAG